MCGACFTSLGVLGSCLRGPRPCLDIAPLLKSEDKASVPDNDLPCLQALQNALKVQYHSHENNFLAHIASLDLQKVFLHSN